MLTERCKIYQHRRDFALERLAQIPGLRVATPKAAFYLFPECGQLIGRTTPQGQQIKSSSDLAQHFLEAGVVVVPGAGFSCDPYFRLSFATSLENIKEGITRIGKACAALI